jgi:hypothetical protein
LLLDRLYAYLRAIISPNLCTMKRCFLFLTLIVFCFNAQSQSLLLSKDFRLGSPYHEPDGRNDIVRLSGGDFITLAKVKGNLTGKSDFVLERYDRELNMKWQTPLSVETFEDFKEVFFNGKETVILSVIHNESAKTTKLEAYGYDANTGAKTWTKELESFEVQSWLNSEHKAKVKESFIDVICEHTNKNFVTPFEYKHNIRFSPDESKFLSYVYNYGEKNLSATVSIYDNQGILLKRGKVTIDNDYVSQGMYINNRGELFILNSNKGGKLNAIRYNLDTKEFLLLELPPSAFGKDDFHVYFYSDDEMYVGNTLVNTTDGKVMGVMYSKFEFDKNEVSESTLHLWTESDRQLIASARKANKQVKGDEDFKDYDFTHFIVHKQEQVILVLERRSLYADGYPHISRGAFEEAHQMEIMGHVQAESVMMLAFDKNDQFKWFNYIAKNQIYSANDGLNTISFVLQETKNTLRVLYVTSANFDASYDTMNMMEIDKNTGKTLKSANLPNDQKLVLVKDYTLWLDNDEIVVVGKKGLLGKTSAINKYKL